MLSVRLASHAATIVLLPNHRISSDVYNSVWYLQWCIDWVAQTHSCIRHIGCDWIWVVARWYIMKSFRLFIFVCVCQKHHKRTILSHGYPTTTIHTRWWWRWRWWWSPWFRLQIINCISINNEPKINALSSESVAASEDSLILWMNWTMSKMPHCHMCRICVGVGVGVTIWCGSFHNCIKWTASLRYHSDYLW